MLGILLLVIFIALTIVSNELIKSRNRERRYRKLLGKEDMIYIPSAAELFEVYDERTHALSLLGFFARFLIKGISLFFSKHRENIKEAESRIMKEAYKSQEGSVI